MSIPGAVNPLLLGGGDQEYQIERSLRFNSSDSAFCSRNFSSTGNRTSWTWSGWVKRSNLVSSSRQVLFGGYGANNDTDWLEFGFGYSFEPNDTFYWTISSSSSSSTAVFRDLSAWYNILVSYNGSNIVAYVNNTTILTSSKTGNLGVNGAWLHTLGRSPNSGIRYFDGYLADVFFIDGQALTPSSFTEVSATTGQLIPKAYTGTYGTNGFHLPFSDNSAATATTLGKDTSGNGNNWTPNNLIAGPAFTSNSWSGYFDGSGDYLTLSPGSSFAFGTGSFTVEAWVFPTSNPAGGFYLIDSRNSVQTTNWAFATRIDGSGSSLRIDWYTGSTSITGSDLSLNSWNHVAYSRSESNFGLFVNGSRVTTGTDNTNYNVSPTTSYIGTRFSISELLNGYMSNVRVVKGTAVYDPTQTTLTVPTTPLTGTTNTSLLTLQDSTFVDNSINNFTITANGNARTDFRSPFEDPVDTDSLVDTPTSYGTDTGAGGEVRGNYCTWNPLDNGGVDLSNGNLDVSNGAAHEAVRTTIKLPSTGKWYAECVLNSFTSGTTVFAFGVDYSGANAPSAWQSTNGNIYIGVNTSDLIVQSNNTSLSSVSATTSGAVLQIAYDADAQKLWLGFNNTWKDGSYGNTGNPSTGTNPTSTTITGGFLVGNFYNSTGSLNAGQRPFAYTTPSGFKALCDTNLPTPVVAKPNAVMDVALWTGTGATRNITGYGFSPDFVWIKGRSQVSNHFLFDAIRGASNRLCSSLTVAEASEPNTLTAFNSDGFSLGTDSGVGACNISGQTYVGWTWDAGSSTVTNTQGSITSQVRANASAGFSIVSYVANGLNGTSVGHGLNVKPAIVIQKNRTNASDWLVLTQLIDGTDDYLLLNSTAAAATAAAGMTSTTFGSWDRPNGNNMIAYCFAPVAGYSSFGSYTGNGNTSGDGPFVFCGFRPRYVLIRNSSRTENWIVHDTARNPYNVTTSELLPNTSGAEGNTTPFDILSNGFKIRNTTTNTGLNANGETHIYAAFAENPFQYARAR